jgi:hypothetical protein
MGRRTRSPSPPRGLREQVDALLDDPGVAWLPIRHHSPGCALHVERWIREHRPAAVLVEGPDDAAELLPHLLDPGTRPPVAVLSVWTDVDGVVRPAGQDGPARFRALWPLVGHGPEWAALVAGRDVGALVRLIDVPHHVLVKTLGAAEPAPGHRWLAESEWFARLAARTGRPTFDAFFDATFEARAHATSSRDFFAELLLFALCTRGASDDASGLERDGTLLREAHMSWHVAEARKEVGAGRIAVVTGAFHAVALAGTRGKRARAKGGKGVQVVLATTSHAALSRLASVPAPGWAALLHRTLGDGAPDPAGRAAEEVLVRVGAALRAAGAPVGTADAVEVAGLARGLARLRGGGPTAGDVREAAIAGFVRGDASLGGAPVERVVDAVCVGDARGVLPPGAGRPPLADDVSAEAKRHRIDLSGVSKVVRCDVIREESHRARSAFLHRASFVGLPLFEALPDGQEPPWFKGPDPIREEGMHLLGETWGIRASDDLEDHLLALSDRGTTLAEVAATSLGRARASAGADLRARTAVVVAAARMRLLELLPAALAELGAVMPVSARFDERVYALRELLALLGSHETLPTFGADTVRSLCERAFTAACLLLPSLARIRPEEVEPTLDDLATLLRAAASEGPAFDREVLVERLRELLAADGAAVVRGAAAGALTGLGALSERALARHAAVAFRGADPHAGAAFLEGVLRTSRATLLTGRRLFAEVHELLERLPPDVFRAVLPDLRRAFAVFVPHELERLGEQVAAAVAPEPPAVTGPPPPAVVARAREVDARVSRLLGSGKADE